MSSEAGLSRRCPCGTGGSLADCCGPWLAGGEPPTAEALMRSRYTAFVLGDSAHLVRTWHPATRPASVTLEADRRWTRLEVLDAPAAGLFATTAEVEFRAHYLVDGTPGAQHERSTFRREGGAWRYFDER